MKTLISLMAVAVLLVGCQTHPTATPTWANRSIPDMTATVESEMAMLTDYARLLRVAHDQHDGGEMLLILGRMQQTEQDLAEILKQ